MIEIQFQYNPLLTAFAFGFMLMFMIVVDRGLSSRDTDETRRSTE